MGLQLSAEGSVRKTCLRVLATVAGVVAFSAPNFPRDPGPPPAEDLANSSCVRVEVIHANYASNEVDLCGS